MPPDRSETSAAAPPSRNLNGRHPPPPSTDNPITRQVERELTLNALGDAERLLQRSAASLLLVRMPQRVANVSTTRQPPIANLLVYDATTGIWSARDDRLRGLVQAAADEYAHLLVDLALAKEVDANRELPAAVRYLRGAAKRLPEIKDAAATVLVRAQDALEPPAWLPRLTVCARHELNADLRYIAAPNGVVDVSLAAIVPAAEARPALVTDEHALPDPFDAAAEHPAIEALFGHMPPDVSEYLWRELGYCLHGRPNRRILQLLGVGGSGKSTVSNAIRFSLGGLASSAPPAALAPAQSSRDSKRRYLDPSAEAWAPPARIVVMPEVEGAPTDSTTMKARCGGDPLTVARLNENPYETEATATTLMIGNDPPLLDWTDEALVDRLRILPHDPVPADQRDDGAMRDLWAAEATARQAFVARLVLFAALTPERPLVLQEGLDRLEQRRVEGEGELAEFVRSTLIPGTTNDHARPAELWRAAAAQFSPDAAGRIEGIGESDIARYARRLLPQLPKMERLRRADGRHLRWPGWTIAGAERAERSFDDDAPFDAAAAEDGGAS